MLAQDRTLGNLHPLLQLLLDERMGCVCKCELGDGICTALEGSWWQERHLLDVSGLHRRRGQSKEKVDFQPGLWEELVGVTEEGVMAFFGSPQ